MRSTPRQILILQTAFTGDVVLATPVIERLRRCFPEAEIDFLLRKGNEGLLVGHPHLRRVLVRDKAKGKARSLFEILRTIRRTRYDLVVNLHRFASSGLIAGFSGGKHICGFDKNPFAWRFHHKVPHVIQAEEGGPHEVERNLSVIAHLTQGPPDPVRLYPSAEDFAAVRQDRPYVCIAPTSVWFTKQWPAEKWVEMIRRIPATYRVFLLGGPGDRDVCMQIAQGSGHPDCRVMAGQLSYLQSAALMQGAAMNYVNDSAPLHFASAMGAPVTAVFCSTVPEFGFGPHGVDGVVLETELDLPCKPCGLHGYRACPQGHFKCTEIAPGRLLDRLPREAY